MEVVQSDVTFKRKKRITMQKFLSIAIILAMIAGCSNNTSNEANIQQDTDSIAYVLGMNVGLNLLKMDSTINIEAVCRGIRDVAYDQPMMTLEEAETFFLGYMNHTLPEKAIAMEEQLLIDLAKTSRDYARTRSGITYAVRTLGNQERIPTASRDSLYLRYRILSLDKQEIYSSYEQGDTIRVRLLDMKNGLQESVKLIGEGGKVEAWIPSQLAYGTEGDTTFNIAPNATLCFEIELVKLDKYAEWQRR